MSQQRAHRTIFGRSRSSEDVTSIVPSDGEQNCHDISRKYPMLYSLGVVTESETDTSRITATEARLPHDNLELSPEQSRCVKLLIDMTIDIGSDVKERPSFLVENHPIHDYAWQKYLEGRTVEGQIEL